MPEHNPESNCCEHGIQWIVPSICYQCLQAEVERLRADNVAMFKNLEEQTTRGLQMVGKWQQAEARLAKVVEVLRTTQLHLIALSECYPQENLITNLRDSLAAHLAAALPEEEK